MEQTDIEQLKIENTRLKQQVKQNTKAKNTEFVLDLVKKGILLPRTKEQAEELLNYACDYDEGEALLFNEGESFLSKLKIFLLNQSPIIHLNREISSDEGWQDATEGFQYAEETPKSAIQLDKAVRAYMKANNVDYKTAFNILHQKGVK